MKYIILITLSLFALACASNKTVPEVSDPIPEEEGPAAPNNLDSGVVLPDTTQIEVFIRSAAPIVTQFKFDSTSAGWNGIVNYYQNRNDSLFYMQTVSLSPKVDWEEFNIFVDFLRIFELPNQQDIPNYFRENPNPNRIYINYSLRRNDKRLSYEYMDPGSEAGEFWQSNNVITFASYISTEFTTSPITEGE